MLAPNTRPGNETVLAAILVMARWCDGVKNDIEITNDTYAIRQTNNADMNIQQNCTVLTIIGDVLCVPTESINTNFCSGNCQHRLYI